MCILNVKMGRRIYTKRICVLYLYAFNVKPSFGIINTFHQLNKDHISMGKTIISKGERDLNKIILKNNFF